MKGKITEQKVIIIGSYEQVVSLMTVCCVKFDLFSLLKLFNCTFVFVFLPVASIPG